MSSNHKILLVFKMAFFLMILTINSVLAENSGFGDEVEQAEVGFKDEFFKSTCKHNRNADFFRPGFCGFFAKVSTKSLFENCR